MGPQTHPNWMEFYRRWVDRTETVWNFKWFKILFQSFRGIHPSQYPPLYPHPGLPAMDRERLGLPPGPQHSMDPNEQMVSWINFFLSLKPSQSVNILLCWTSQVEANFRRFWRNFLLGKIKHSHTSTNAGSEIEFLHVPSTSILFTF